VPQRNAAVQAPANFAPVIATLAVVAGLLALTFQLPGALIIAAGISAAGFFFNAPPQLNAKEVVPEHVQRQSRRWRDLRWRALIPNGDWLVNRPEEMPAYRNGGRALTEKIGTKLPAAVRAPLGMLGEGLGAAAWLILPSRWVPLVALSLAAAIATIPANLSSLAQWMDPEYLAYDLLWLNVVYTYAVVMTVDAVTRRTAAVADPSPGVPISHLTGKAATGDGGAWRALIGFGFLAAVIAVGISLTLLSLELGYLLVPVWLTGSGLGVAAAAGCLHGVSRTGALAAWREKVAARAAWEPRWEAMKNPEVRLIDHATVGSFVVDTFEAPPSLGSAKAINLYNTVVPYLAAGGEVTVAMLTVPALDSQGQPIPGSAHATRFRVVVAPADAEVKTRDTDVDIAELSLAAEVGAFNAAREMGAQVPILLGLEAAHTPDSPVAVWKTTWTVPLASAMTVAWSLGVDPETGIFNEGRDTFFGDFDAATLGDRTLPARMTKAAYEARWIQRWADALKQGEKPPHLQYGAVKRERLSPTQELVYEPFLVGQGLSPAQYFGKSMRERLSTTLKAAPFVAVIGLTGRLAAAAGRLEDGMRHAQGFCVVHSATPIPTNPADIASPGPRAREVANWVMGGIINRAFEDAKLAYPEVISAEALTRPQSKGHVWKVHLRLYEGVTAAMLKLNAVKLAQAMGGARYLRFEESTYGAYVIVGAMPRAEGVKFANPMALAYCDKLDWMQAFQDVGVRSVTDGSSPLMLDNTPHETNPKITRLTFSMPAGLNLAKIREVTDKLRAATANDYVDIRPGDTPDKFVVLAAEQNPIPFPAVLDWDASADLSGKGEHSIPFGYATDGTTVSLNWKNDFHMMVLGGSGSGKSSFMQVLVAGAVLRDSDIFVMDPTKGGVDFEFAAPWIRGFAREGQHLGAGELTQRIGMEMEARKKLNGQYGVGNYRDLPAEVRPRHMFVIIDEFQSLIKEVSRGTLKAPDTTDEVELELFEQRKNINDGVRKTAMWIGKFGREARSVGITVILAGQGIKADELKAVGLQGMKTNFSRVALGKMTHGDMASAFKDVSILPNLGSVVPQGRGIFEGTSGDPVVIQSWFEPGGQAEMARLLAEHMPPIDDATRIDVTELEDRVKSATPKGFGELVEDELPVDDDEETIALDASELGLDIGGMSFEDLDFAADGDTTADAATEAVPSASDDAVVTPAPEPAEAVDDAPCYRDMVVIGETVVFGEHVAFGDGSVTGWAEGDALATLLSENPAITDVVWVDPMLDELDDIGIPRRDIAADLCTQHGVTLWTGDDDDDTGDDTGDAEPTTEPEPETASAPETAPVPVTDLEPQAETTPSIPAPASLLDPPAAAPEPESTETLFEMNDFEPAPNPTLFDMDDFEEPRFDQPPPKVPDLSDAHDLFAPRTTNAPKVTGIEF
jgi:hypothetical protein